MTEHEIDTESFNRHLETLQRHGAKASASEPYRENAADVLGRVIESAKREIGYREHYASGSDTLIGITEKPAVATGVLNVRELAQTGTRAADGVHTRALGGELAGQTSMLSASIINQSRVAKAGARVIIAAERPGPSVGDVVALYRDAARFDLVEAAQFAEIVDGENVTVSAFPMHTATIEWGDAPSIACSFKATRAQMRDIGGEQLRANLVQSLLFGLAQAADKTLLSAIVAETPAAFTLGAAAARNLEFQELRALVGTAGNGAVVGQDGTLRAGGVLAELTPTIATTVIGAFNRAAVGVHPDIALHVSRLNLNGDLEFTVFANMTAAVPDAGAFFSVAGEA